MKEIIGGLWFAGFLAWAIFGFIPGTVFILFGISLFFCEMIKEKRQDRASQNWRKSYPSYKY